MFPHYLLHGMEVPAGRRWSDSSSGASCPCEGEDPFFRVLDRLLDSERNIRAVRRDRFRQLRLTPCWSAAVQCNELRAARRDHSQSIARTVAEIARAKLWSRGTL